MPPLTDLRHGFRDDRQRKRVQRVVHDRLADDRDPQECRHLMRFWWQLLMPYQEVSERQLDENVSPAKLALVHALVTAVRTDHAAIDAWADQVERTLPVVHDRGYAATHGDAEAQPGSRLTGIGGPVRRGSPGRR